MKTSPASYTSESVGALTFRNKCAAYEQQLSLLRERQQEVENALRLRIKILEEDLKMLQGYRENKVRG